MPPHPIHRVEVRVRPELPDARAAGTLHRARQLGFAPTGVRTARVYLLEAALAPAQLAQLQSKLLADPVVELASTGAQPVAADASLIEVHPLPGVMDPAAQSVRDAIRDLLGIDAHVSTGTRYDLLGLGPAEATNLARAALANPAIHQITTAPYLPAQLPKGTPAPFRLTHVALRELSDEQLQTLSRQAHLFLNLEEMRAIQAEFRTLGRDPTDLELETLAQTWSEHCVHKTLKATIRYTQAAGPSTAPSLASLVQGRPGHTVHPDGSVTIDNLLKRTVAAATFELIRRGVDWTLSVFKDNSGVVAFDEQWAVNIKVETHNRPSAIEPYGGAATGIGGCIRDVIATGLGAKPIASTDVFCVADPTRWAPGADKRTENGETRAGSASSLAAPSPLSSLPSPFSSPRPLPPGVLHPRRVLTDVVAGVRDYGNRMGIPTVTGGVFFDDRFVGNPLVFCGCVGLLPRTLVQGQPRAGDRIIALGGRTGRDGIHGATFSSAELQSSSASEFSHAVQIGNAIEEKRLLDAILRARDAGPLYSAMTDCGAGGFSSAIGEMAKELGALVTLENAPTKYAGLTYAEVWISEAQERIVLAVPPAQLAALRAICDQEGVELADLGSFGHSDASGQPTLTVTWMGHTVGSLPTEFLHDGLPNPTRSAHWDSSVPATPTTPTPPTTPPSPPAPPVAQALRTLLAHPTIASKHWIIRQYDHEVQGNTVIKPLVGPLGRGPSDAAVLQPVPDSSRGIALSQGLQSAWGDPLLGGDPYMMALASVDECVRNLVCTGADPARTAILDNFCWASCENPANLARLVRACVGCYDAALAYGTPFVSGKDSLSNQLRSTDPKTGQPILIEVPPTLLITGLGIVPDVGRATTMDAKRAGNLLVLLSATAPGTWPMGGSVYQRAFGLDASLPIEAVDAQRCPALARAVADAISRGAVASAHDASEGGVLVAVAEMLIAGSTPAAQLGCTLAALGAGESSPNHALALAFGEGAGRYVLEIAPQQLETLRQTLERHAPACHLRVLGELTSTARLRWPGQGLDEDVEELARVWRAPLDW